MPFQIRGDVLAESLAQRSRGGVLAYFGLATLLATGTSLGRDHRGLAVALCAGTLAVALARMWLSLSFGAIHARRPRAWLWAFRAGAIFAAAYWGATAAAILARGSPQDALIALVTTAGVAAGAATSLSPDRGLVAVHLVALLGPLTAVILADGTVRAGAMAASIALYYIFLVRQAAQLRQSLFESRKNAELLEARAVALEVARAKAEKAEAAALLANRAKTVLLANMSHEVRTPMATILGYSEMLLSGTLSEEERTPCLEIVHRSSEQLLRMLNDVLDLARIEAGSLTMRPARFDLPALVREVEGFLRPLADERRLDFTVVLKALVPNAIVSDAVRLRQLLSNLGCDAIKGCESGGISMIVRFEGTGAAASLRVDVVETGAKTASERRLETEEATAGGLGLAIARGLARAFGGELHTRRSAGRDFFSLEVPVTLGSDVASASLRASGNFRSEGPGLERVRVLTVEDTAGDSRLASLLRAHGAEVEVVADEQAAVGAVLATPHAFDVVLLDVRRETLGGQRSVARLRAARYQGGVIGVSRVVSDGERERNVDAGFDEQLAATVGERALVDAVQRHAGAARSMLEANTLAADAGGTAPLVSAMAGDPIVAPILEDFLDDLAARRHALGRALSRRDGPALKRIAHVLAGVGGSYGFDALTDSARVLETSASASGDFDALRGPAAALSVTCERIMAGRLARCFASPTVSQVVTPSR